MFSLGCCDQIAVRKTIKYAGIYVFRTSKERKRSLGNASLLAGIGSFENERA